MRPELDLFPGWAERRPRVGEAEIDLRTTGAGAALLWLHGYPQTPVGWHKIAPALARHCTLIVADLRGLGASSVPQDERDADRENGRKIACPILIVCGGDYPGKRGAEPLRVWQGWCSDLAGAQINSGHLLAEENPQAMLAVILPFLFAHGGRP